MLILFEGVTEFLTGGFHRQPEPANDNRRLLTGGITPIQALCFTRMVRAKIRRENAERMTLIADPKRRRFYDELAAMERCILWHHFERRD